MNTAIRTPPTRPATRTWWRACTRNVGAYGMTAVLGLGTMSAAVRGCGDDPPTPRERVIEITNLRRDENDVAPVRTNADLNWAAQLHSQDQADRDVMSHTGSDGSNAGQRISRQGYRWITYGENVAAGYPTASAVMRGWMNSAGHRRNILHPGFKDIGVGLATSDDGTRYWTMVLASRG